MSNARSSIAIAVALVAAAPADYFMQWTLNVNPDPFLSGTITITRMFRRRERNG